MHNKTESNAKEKYFVAYFNKQYDSINVYCIRKQIKLILGTVALKMLHNHRNAF